MGHVVILGVFVADTAYRAERMPIIGVDMIPAAVINAMCQPIINAE